MVKNTRLVDQLGNLSRQLKSRQTRGNNPRPLTIKEIISLEQRSATLRAQIQEARSQRTAERVNRHTSAEAERIVSSAEAERIVSSAEAERIVSSVTSELRGQTQTLVEHVSQQTAPLTDLVVVRDQNDPRERVRARTAQMAVLQAANRLDRSQPKPAKEKKPPNVKTQEKPCRHMKKKESKESHVAPPPRTIQQHSTLARDAATAE
jgi:hypothetical protein